MLTQRRNRLFSVCRKARKKAILPNPVFLGKNEEQADRHPILYQIGASAERQSVATLLGLVRSEREKIKSLQSSRRRLLPTCLVENHVTSLFASEEVRARVRVRSLSVYLTSLPTK